MNFLKAAYCRIYQGCFRLIAPRLPYREPCILAKTAEIPPILREKGIDSVLVVTDKGIRDCGLLEKPLEQLNNEGIKVTVFDGTVPNPTIENIEAGKRLYEKSRCEAIIGFGGGSSLDCAKIIGARIACPGKTVAQMRGLLKIRKQLPLLIAVPTTAGTGSEVTVAAVICDEKKKEKYPINDFSLIPAYAVLDETLTFDLPPFLTATTGMDALTHAVEAYIGQSTTKKTARAARDAVQMIHENLLTAYHYGHDREARKEMLCASYFAGVAFTRSYVGYVHGVAHSLGGRYGIAHGLANAVLLPVVLEAYGPAVYAKLAELGRMLGVAAKDDSDETASAAFIMEIRMMNWAMGIPEKLVCIREQDIPSLAKAADRESNPLYPVPKLMNKKELEQLYYAVMK